MKDAYWFRHDSNARNDEKIIDLRGDLGYEGYGIYWAIIEFLRDTENYEAEFKPKRLAMVLQVSQDLIEQVISGYKLFQRDENGMFYSISLKSRMKEMDRKREVQRVKANLRWHPDGKQAKKDRESQSNATALPQECHKNKEDKIIEKEKTVENSRQDERVQGEKVNQIFISDCLEVRNAYPINLLFEYIFFIGNYKLESAEEYRANFINYWKRSGAEKNIRDIKKRLVSMAYLGFELDESNVKINLKRFLESNELNKTEAECYLDFLSYLKSEGFKPSDKFNKLAQPYLKF